MNCLFAATLLLASEANAGTFRCERKLVSLGRPSEFDNKRN